MSGQKPWSQHFQTDWQARAGDPRLPLWLRVASLAYGTHRRNGHACFGPGQVGLVLATVDHSSGEIDVPDRRTVSDAVRRAVSFGFLAVGSGTRCLVVPSHAVAGGGFGDPFAPCEWHDRGRQRLRQTRT